MGVKMKAYEVSTPLGLGKKKFKKISVRVTKFIRISLNGSVKILITLLMN